MLNWLKNLIKVRKKMQAFGRGSIEILCPANAKIIAFIRKYEDEKVLCIYNLSRQAQYFDLDLQKYADLIPVEMFGGMRFPPISEVPYFFTLPGHRFFWFNLKKEV